MSEALDTASGITRFLRSKDASIDEILATANKLYSGELNTYLPNKIDFLFSLLCDRLNDNSNKAFKQWKLHAGVWEFFLQIWSSTKKDADAFKQKSLRKFKVVDSLTNTLKQIDQCFASGNASDLLDVLSSAFKVAEVFVKDTYVEIDENQAILLFSSYITVINRFLQSQVSIPHSLINNWTVLVKMLYQLPRVHATYKPSKKNMTKFVTEALPSSLTFVKESENIDTLDDPRHIVEEVIKQTIFDDEMKQVLKSNIELAVSKHSKSFSKSTIELLFTLIINELAARDIQVCEDIFITIVKTKDFNYMSEDLLKILSSVNRALSHAFFDSIYKAEIQLPSVNWKLISYAIELDFELALENYNEILDKVRSSDDQTSTYKIGNNLAEAYFKAREFNQFLQKVWPEAIQIDPIWKSSRYIDYISKRLVEFSTNQITSLLDHSFALDEQVTSSLPLIIAIIKALLSSPQPKKDAVKNILLENKLLKNDTSDQVWEARYYLLCLYGEEAFEANSESLQKLLAGGSSTSVFYFYSLLRVIEITANDESSPQYKENFITFLSAYKGDDLHIILHTILKRWVVLLNAFFTRDQILVILKLIMTHLNWEETLLPFFKSESDALFEQSTVMNALNSFVLEQLQNKSGKAFQSLELVSCIPVYCFDRHTKKQLIETIADRHVSSRHDSINLLSRVAIKHLLSIPSNTSTLELDFNGLVSLLQSSSSKSQSISAQIIRSVWTNHLSQVNSSEHKTFILSSLKQLILSCSKGVTTSITPELDTALCILSVHVDSRSEEIEETRSALLTAFTSQVSSLLKASIESISISSDVVEWSIRSLCTVLRPNSDKPTELFTLIKEIDIKVSDGTPKDKALFIKVSLFNLLTKISVPTFKNSIFITSLYIALHSEASGIDAIESLSEYYTRLSENNDVFERLYSIALSTAKSDLTANNCGALMQILSLLSSKLTKKYQKSHRDLFVSTLSVVMGKFEMVLESAPQAAMFSLTTLKQTLSDSIWVFNQYSIELTLAFVNKVSKSLNLLDCTDAVEIYVLLTHILAHVLLFHRFRLTSRHHIVIGVFTTLLENLSMKYHRINKKTNLCFSAVAAAAYSRVLANLCEPSSSIGMKDAAENALSSSSALLKKSLRQHLHILLVNYIYYQLKFNFESKVSTELSSGIYCIFDVLSRRELHVVNISLDTSGRAYYRTLYASYKDHGKWKDE